MHSGNESVTGGAYILPLAWNQNQEFRLELRHESSQSMSPSNEDFWRQFDELDRRRRRSYRRHEEAFRRLDPSTAEPVDSTSRDTWREYCETVKELERSVAELESLTWRLGKSS